MNECTGFSQICGNGMQMRLCHIYIYRSPHHCHLPQACVMSLHLIVAIVPSRQWPVWNALITQNADRIYTHLCLFILLSQLCQVGNGQTGNGRFGSLVSLHLIVTIVPSRQWPNRQCPVWNALITQNADRMYTNHSLDWNTHHFLFQQSSSAVLLLVDMKF